MGATVAVTLDHDWLTDKDLVSIRRMWSRALADESFSSHIDLELDAPVVRHATSVERLANSLSSAVTLAALDHGSGRLLQLHAAGLAEPGTGRTVAFVAASGTGKTTVARTLGVRWGYLTDETVALDPSTLAVASHPKPLSVGASGSVKAQHGPDELGLLPEPAAPILARIVLLERDPDHDGPPSLTPVPLTEAIGRLIPEASYLSRFPHPLATMADVLTRTGGALALRYADAADLVDILDQVLEAPASDDPWERVDDARVHDAVTIGTGLVLFSHADPAQVVVLHGVGPMIWRLLGDGNLTEAELVDAVVDEHGTPPDKDANDIVGECTRSLRDLGLIPPEQPADESPPR